MDNNLQRMRTLLVEDDYGDAALVEVFLKDAWPENPPDVRHVTRLSDARHVLRESGADIVLCDLSLPDAEGIDAVRGLCDGDVRAPLIVLTGRSDPELPLQLIEQGAQDYLNKREMTPENLARAIRYSIERNRQAMQLRAAMRIQHYRQGVLANIVKDRSLSEVLHQIGMLFEAEADCTGFSCQLNKANGCDEVVTETGGVINHGSLLHVPAPGREHRLFMIVGSAGEQLGQWVVSPSQKTVGDILGMCAVHACELAALAIERYWIHREQRLASLVFSASWQCIVITNAARKIVSVNPAYCRLLGKEEGELINTEPGLWTSGVHEAEFYAEMWHSLERSGAWMGEVCDRSRTGTMVTMLATINAVYGSNGRVERYVCLLTDISERKAAEEVIAKFANYDPLTHLPNRRLFMERLERAILNADRDEKGFALLFIDLDYFKEINDSLGHQYGDMLLQQSADRLMEVVRSSDTVARLGGDEFTVIFPGVLREDHVVTMVSKILDTLGAPFQLEDEQVKGGASIGVSVYPRDGKTADELLRHSDQAMYKAKKEGRGRYRFFTDEMQQEAQGRLRLHQDILVAIQQRQLTMHYQAIVNARTDELVKVEALMRWVHPERGNISPAIFIPMAEELGLIGQLGNLALTEVLAQMRLWQQQSRVVPWVSINKSPRQFLNLQRCEEWLQMIDQLGIHPPRLTIEITENVLLDGNSEIVAELQKFRERGIQIAVDDFGTGYSSLGYLRRFPVDYIKLDKSFIADIAVNRLDHDLVDGIVAMCRKLGIQVIAEGVETEAQRDALLALGCDLMQGWLFGKPVPANQLNLSSAC